MGVPYRTRPQLRAHFEDCREVTFGERILVKQVCDGWVKDVVAWLPLELDGDSLFKVIDQEGPDSRRACSDDVGRGCTRTSASWDSEDWGFPGMDSPCIPVL